MEYTIQKLSRLAGVSTRTLRFYDEIGLLKPKRTSSSGYRIYGEAEVGRLQQILFFKQLSFSLEEIKKAMDDPEYDAERALLAHRQALLEKKEEIELLIRTVDATLDEKRGGKQMSAKEKFEGLKRELLDENENRYGKETREKYGEETIRASKKQFVGMSEADFDAMQDTAARLQEMLTEAMATGDANGEMALAVAALHKQWLSYTWPSYSPEAHRGLAQMYVDDERFTAYYDNASGKGAAAFLRDAIYNYTDK
ncbi:MerR family transcriptional regulator [Trichococcus ilyis]|uniref:DNA-binding transcriptional regulator, MerR family n=1 Tax=Trichococcus ilyis TaxID=640938 RepID=A0A143Z3L9_9LACT|nr:MerR family transcriptional regulator [Trichococcus ilyis]CZR03672.1 merr bacterial regulatory protein hth signature [Trichococcus ilyis]SEJ42326.1 DNA-binding transcriptional regulator, MerR family [Trichococcus ilyis]